MVGLQPGTVVLTDFPYSDLSGRKLRPALVVAKAEFGDFILCQITSNPKSSKLAIKINKNSFESGDIAIESFVRPDKLFTASMSLIEQELGTLKAQKLNAILQTIQELFR